MTIENQPENQDFATSISCRILLTDDLPINIRVVSLLLGRIGYSAEVAENGLQALEALERHPFDIVFMDVQMPEMDGLTCTREICKKYPLRERPWIIAMTANVQESDTQICLSAGMDDYISKPLNENSITTAILRANEGLINRRALV